jgi:hypothetical protein
MSLPITNLPLFQIGNQWSDKNGFLTPITAQFVQNLMARVGGVAAPSNTVLGNNTGVVSFNTRTGVVTLEGSDVDAALGYTPVPPTGNVATASALAIARSITMTGAGSWTVNFDGSGNVTAAMTLTPGQPGIFSTVTASGTITPASVAGIVGTTAADSAQAGSIGEVMTATGTAVSLTSGTPANVTTLALSAGDWWVFGGLTFNPAATTTITVQEGGVSTSTAVLPGAGNLGSLFATATAGKGSSFAVPMTRVNVSVPTTVYLVASASFGVSTMTVTGILNAIRMR